MFSGVVHFFLARKNAWNVEAVVPSGVLMSPTLSCVSVRRDA